MRPPTKIGTGLGLFAVLQLGCVGCTVSITPAWHANSPPPASAAAPNPVTAPTAGAPPGGTPPIPPGAPGVMPPAEQISLLAQKLSASEDERRALASRLHQVEVSLTEKNQTVVQAGYEVQESTKQMKRTREELERWRKEMDDMRTKFRTVERENRATLETILKALEQNAERQERPHSERSSNDRPNTEASTYQRRQILAIPE